MKAFLSEKHGLLINGRFAPAADGRSFAVENPAQERAIAQVAQGGPADVDRAVARRGAPSRRARGGA